MSGTDNILKVIKSETETKVCQILKEAQEKASDFASDIERQTDGRVDKIIEDLKVSASFIEAKGKLSLDVQKKKNILKIKRKIVADIIEKAKSYFKNLPDEEYFLVVLKMIEKFSLPQKGKILFSKEDLSRLPEGFELQINQICKGKNGELSISSKTNDADFGFVLVYGLIEENCTFDAIFRSKYDELLDIARDILFD
ncbi:MAG: hypothetical protein LBH37_00435 [Oscillospiraceae bacterium]|nr:hypothetical protein [Oscillospiraceae bacterium]